MEMHLFLIGVLVDRGARINVDLCTIETFILNQFILFLLALNILSFLFFNLFVEILL